jgi:ABC-type glycerol-3-phosphate transport system substrate-binding protein
MHTMAYMRTRAAAFASVFVVLATATTACSSKSAADDADSQEGAYSQYQPNRSDAGDASSEASAAAIQAEAPGVELDQNGMPKNKSINGFSFSGCEYWPFAVSASPYPDHIVWGCTPGSSPQAQDCMAAGMRRLAVILTNPPPELLKVKEKYGIRSFFNWNNDYYGAPEGRRGTESIYLYNGSLIKWRTGTNRDGTCNLPEKSDLVNFLNQCLTGDDAGPGC